MNTNELENGKGAGFPLSDGLDRTSLIRRQDEKPIDDHPCKIYWNRPYDPGTLWVCGIDAKGRNVWV